ncbi:Inositol-3-phosphate synthase 1 [Entomortierella lignicola]|nr:Inositol-3-phosphate synthase 1 [Entomortierella lignicola]
MPPFAAEQVHAAAPLAFKVNSKNVKYTDSHIISDYVYENATVTKGVDGSYSVNPTSVKYTFKTDAKVPRVG